MWEAVQGHPPHEWVGLVRPTGFTPDEHWGATLCGWTAAATVVGVGWSLWRGRTGWACWWALVGVTMGAATVWGYTTITYGAASPATGYIGTVVDIGPWRWCRVGDLVRHAGTMADAFDQAGWSHLQAQRRTGYPGALWPAWWDDRSWEYRVGLDPWTLSSDRGGLLDKTRLHGVDAAHQWERLHPPGWPERAARSLGGPRGADAFAWALRLVVVVGILPYLD